MSSCTDRELGQLLHDYELELLSADDRHRFGLHLYDCEYCLAQVREFTDASRILKHDPDVMTIVEDLATEPSDTKGGRARKKFAVLTKLLMAAVIVTVIAVPAYIFWLQPEPTSVAQTLHLLPGRTGGNDLVYLEKGDDVRISFYVGEGFQGSADIVIAEVEGDTVLFQPGLSDFNELGLGSITLSVSKFSEGHYTLTITPKRESGVPQKIYMFRVK